MARASERAAAGGDQLPIPVKRAFALLVRHYMWTRGTKFGPDGLLEVLDPKRTHGKDLGQDISTLIYSGTAKRVGLLRDLFLAKVLVANFFDPQPPLHVAALIHSAYIDKVVEGFDRTTIGAFGVGTSPTMILPRSANFDQDEIDKITDDYAAIWHVFRFSHDGDRLVRAAMAIEKPDIERTSHPFTRFKIYFRTSELLASLEKRSQQSSKQCYVAEGSIMPLRGGKYMLFAGVDQTQDGVEYPLFIVSHMRDPLSHVQTIGSQRIRPVGKPDKFIATVSRHHHDKRVFFSAPCAFVRSRIKSIEDYPVDKIRSWDKADGIEKNKDVDDLDQVLIDLRLQWPKEDAAFTV